MQYLQMGACDAGFECPYFHSEAERRTPLPNTSNNRINSSSSIASTREEHRPVIPEMCSFIERGGCGKGNQCKLCAILHLPLH